jgi:hypothetical protein
MLDRRDWSGLTESGHREGEDGGRDRGDPDATNRVGQQHF